MVERIQYEVDGWGGGELGFVDGLVAWHELPMAVAADEGAHPLVDRIRDCNLAITGTGEKRDHVTGETLQVLGNWVRRIPFDDVQPLPPGGRTPTVVSGARLRVLVIDLLDAVGAPVSPPEIERLLRLQGVVPAGRPSQTIANALRPAVRDGRVTVVERGWYEAS